MRDIDVERIADACTDILDEATDSKALEDIALARANVGMSYLVKLDVVKPKRHQYIYAFKDIDFKKEGES